MLDMGPYYLTALIALMGPVKESLGLSGKHLKNVLLQVKQSMEQKSRLRYRPILLVS